MTFKKYWAIRWFVLILALWFRPANGWTSPADEDDIRFKVISSNGAVTAYHDERDETVRLRNGESVDDGDNVTTGAKSEVLLNLPGKGFVYLGPHTKIHISRLRTGDKGLQVRLNLLTGDLWGQLDKTPRFIFETSMQSLICRCHGTLFEVFRQKNAVRVTSFEGAEVTVSHAQVKMAKTGEITQYIQGQFRYKHRLKPSDQIRLSEWKSHLSKILAKIPAQKPLNR